MKNRKKMKKIIAIIIAAIILAVSLPLVSFAETEMQEVIETVNEDSQDAQEVIETVNEDLKEDTETAGRDNQDTQGNPETVDEDSTEVPEEEPTVESEDENPEVYDDMDAPEELMTMMTMNLMASAPEAGLPEEYSSWEIEGKEEAYDTLYEAVNAASDGDTIQAVDEGKLVYIHSDREEELEKVSEDSYKIKPIDIKKNDLTIDFNGCTASDKPIVKKTVSADYMFSLAAGRSCIVINGTIDSERFEYTYYYGIFSGENACNYSIKNMTFLGEDCPCLAAGRGSSPYFNVNLISCNYHYDEEEAANKYGYLVQDGAYVTAYDCQLKFSSPMYYRESRTVFRNCDIKTHVPGSSGYSSRDDKDVIYYDSNVLMDGIGTYPSTVEYGPGEYVVSSDEIDQYIDVRKYSFSKTTGAGRTDYTVKLKQEVFSLTTELPSGESYTSYYDSLETAFNNPFPGDDTCIVLNDDITVYDNVEPTGLAGVRRDALSIDLNGYDIIDLCEDSTFNLDSDFDFTVYDSDYYDMNRKCSIDKSGSEGTGSFVRLNGANVNLSNISLIAGKKTDGIFDSKHSTSVVVLDNTDIFFPDDSISELKMIYDQDGIAGQTEYFEMMGEDSVYKGFSAFTQYPGTYFYATVYGGKFYTDFMAASSYNAERIKLAEGCVSTKCTDETGEYIQINGITTAYAVYDSNGKLIQEAATLKEAVEVVPDNGTVKLLTNVNKANDSTVTKTLNTVRPMTLDLNNHTLDMIIDQTKGAYEAVTINAGADLSIINGELTTGYHYRTGYYPSRVYFVRAGSTGTSRLLIKNVRLGFDTNYYSGPSYVTKSGNFKSMLFSSVDFSGFMYIEQGTWSLPENRISRYVDISFTDDPSFKVRNLFDNLENYGSGLRGTDYNAVIYSGDYSNLRDGLISSRSGEFYHRENLRILGGKFRNGEIGNYDLDSDYAIEMKDNSEVVISQGYTPSVSIVLSNGNIIDIAAKRNNPEQFIYNEYKNMLSTGDTLKFTDVNTESLDISMDFTSDTVFAGRYTVDLNGHGVSSTSGSIISAYGNGITVKLTDSADGNEKFLSGNGNMLQSGAGAKLILKDLRISLSGGNAVYATNSEANVDNVVFSGDGTCILTSGDSLVTVGGLKTEFKTAEAVLFDGSENSVKIEGGVYPRMLNDGENKVAFFDEGCGIIQKFNPVIGYYHEFDRNGGFINPTKEYTIDDDSQPVINDLPQQSQQSSGSTKKGSGGGGGSGSGGGGGSGSGGGGGGESSGGPGGEAADKALLAAAPAAQGTSSPNWFASADGTWKIKNSAGQVVTNAWVCDDVVAANGQNVWYMVGPTGAMVTAGLVRDFSGKLYALETDKNSPYYGMMRYKNGYYNCNGQQVYLEFSQAHDGTFGTVINPEGIAALQAIYGITDFSVSNTQSVHTATF